MSLNCNISLKDCKNTHKYKRADIDKLALECDLDPKEYKSRVLLCDAIITKRGGAAEIPVPKVVQKKKVVYSDLEDKPLEDYLLKELKEIAKKEGYVRYSNLKKAELIELIREQRGLKGVVGKIPAEERPIIPEIIRAPKKAKFQVQVESDDDDVPIVPIKKRKPKITKKNIKNKIYELINSIGTFKEIENRFPTFGSIKNYIRPLIIEQFSITKEDFDTKYEGKELIKEVINEIREKYEEKEESDDDEDIIVIKKVPKPKSPERVIPLPPRDFSLEEGPEEIPLPEEPPSEEIPLPEGEPHVESIFSIRPSSIKPSLFKTPTKESRFPLPTPFEEEIPLPTEEPPSETKFPRGDIEDILVELQETETCNPSNNEYCQGNLVCDVTTKPGKCITPEKAKSMNLIELKYNGRIIVGTQKAISLLKDTLNKDIVAQPIFEEEEIDVYNIGNTIKVNSGPLKDSYVRIEKIDKEKDEVYVRTPEGLLTVLKVNTISKPISEREYINIEEPVPFEEEIVIKSPPRAPRVKYENIDSLLKEIENIPDEDLSNINIANNQILKCLGLIS